MLSISFMHQIFNMPFVSKNFITLLHATAVSSPQNPLCAALAFCLAAPCRTDVELLQGFAVPSVRRLHQERGSVAA